MNKTCQDLYDENYKVLMEKVLERHTMFMYGKTQYSKDVNYPYINL